MSVINFYQKLPKHLREENVENPNYGKTNFFNFPMRACVVGSSGAGKSNWVANFLTVCPDVFDEIHLLCKNKNEPIYNLLSEKLKGSFHIYEKYNELPPLDSFDKKNHTLMIFDDVVLDKNQSQLIEYFIRGRKLNITTIYLTQNYAQTPISIRRNCNWLVLIKIPSKSNLNYVLNDFGLGVDKEQLMKMYQHATKEKFNFMMINLDESDINKRFFKNFTETYKVE